MPETNGEHTQHEPGRSEEEPQSFDTPGILVRLAELEEIAMVAARDTRRGLDAQLHAVCTAHRLLLDRLMAIDLRDLQAGQRFLEGVMARNRAKPNDFD